MTKHKSSIVTGAGRRGLAELPFTGIVNKTRLAARLLVDRKTIEHWMGRGIIPYFKLGRLVRFDAEAVMKHLREHHQIGGVKN